MGLHLVYWVLTGLYSGVSQLLQPPPRYHFLFLLVSGKLIWKWQEKFIRMDISGLFGASEHPKEETIRKGSWTTEAQQVPLSHGQGPPIQE